MEQYFYSYHIYNSDLMKAHYGHGTITYDGDDLGGEIDKAIGRVFDIKGKTVHLIALNRIN